MSEILEIEERCFGAGFAWGEEDFIRCLRMTNVMGISAERDERVVGFMIYHLQPGSLEVFNFAVHPKHWRTGVGRAMVKKLIDKLSPQRRTRIILTVRESNLQAQKFFAAVGFEATQVVREPFEDTREDGYRMELVYGVQPSRRENVEANQGHGRRS